MKNILLTYEKDENDIKIFAENYYEFSKRVKKTRLWIMTAMYVIIALIAYPVHKIIEEGLLQYLLFVLIICIVTTIPGLQGFKKDTIKNVKKQLNTANIGALGNYQTTITEEDIHVAYRPGNPKKERNISSKWEEVDFYSRDNDHFFIFIEKTDFVYHIIAGDQAEEVDYLLKQKIEEKKKKE